MKVWLPIFLAVFVVAEALQWAQGLTLPTPVFVVAGVILAAVSNWDRQAGIPFKWFRQWQDFQGPTSQGPTSQGQDFQAIAQMPPPAAPSIPSPSRPTVTTPNETASVQFQEIRPRSQSQGTPTESEKVL